MNQHHRLPRRSLLGLGAGLALGGLGLRVQAQDAPPTEPAKPSGPLLIYAVRHAEKAKDGTHDPPLTQAGKARANELARVLADVKLDGLYSTNTIRTRTTGAFVAAHKTLEITPYAPGRLAPALKTKLGQTILVVGHSNTVPILLRGLGASFSTRYLSGYDDLFLVVVAGGHTVVQNLHYGAPDGAPTPHARPTSKPASRPVAPGK